MQNSQKTEDCKGQKMENELIGYLWDKLDKNAGKDVIVVTPSEEQRTGLIKEVFSFTGRKGWSGLRFLTLPALGRELLEWLTVETPKQLSASEASLIFHAVARHEIKNKKLPALERIADFPGTIRRLYHEFRKIRQAGLWEAYIRQTAAPDQEIIRLWRSYLQMLNTKNWCDMEGLYELLDDFLQDPRRKHDIAARIHSLVVIKTAGYNGLQEKLLCTLAGLTEVEFLILGKNLADTDFLPAGLSCKNTIIGAGDRNINPGIESLLQYWHAPDDIQNNEKNWDGVQVFLAPGIYAEVWEIGRQCKILLHYHHYTLNDLVIATRDIETYLPVIREVFARQGIPFVCPCGEELLLHPFCLTFTALMEASISGPDKTLLETIIRYHWLPGLLKVKDEMINLLYEIELDFTTGDWQEELRAYHRKAAVFAEKDHDGLQMEATNRKLIMLESCLKYWPEIFAIINDLRQIDDMKTYIEKLLLIAYNWRPSPDCDPSYGQAYLAWTGILQSFLNLDIGPALADLKKRDLLSLISDALARYAHNPGTKQGILICRPEEIQGRNFKAVFITGIVEGAYPSFSEQKWFHPLAENQNPFQYIREKTRERFLFGRLLSSAGERLYLCAPYLDEGGRDIRISSFLEEIIARLGPDKIIRFPLAAEDQSGFSTAVTPGEWISSSASSSEIINLFFPELKDALQSQVERDDPVLYARSKWRGYLEDESCRRKLRETFHPDYIYSVSLLNDYAYCPFFFYMKRVLDIQPESVMNLDAIYAGFILHGVLEKFLRGYLNRPMHLGQEKQYQDELENLLESELSRDGGSPGINSRQKEFLRTTLKRWLHFELLKNFEMENRFTPYALEWFFGQSNTFRLEKPDGDESIYLQGRIDRVDRDAQGRFWIFDYKLSAHLPGFLTNNEGDLQIPLYMAAAQHILKQPLWGGGYYFLNDPGIYGIYLEEGKAKTGRLKGKVLSKTEWEDLLLHKLGLIFQYRKQILAGDFHPSPGNCRKKCRYKTICRVKAEYGGEEGIGFE